MKTFTFFVFALVLVCTGLASPSPTENHSLIRHRRQSGFFQNTGISAAWDNYRKLVQELVDNLNKAAQQTKDAVTQFNQGLLEQAKQCREKFMENLKKLQENVSESIQKLQDKFTGSGSAIQECIASHRDDAQTIYQDASEQMSVCTDGRLEEGENLMKQLGDLGDNGKQIATEAFAEMRNCTEQHSGNILAVGSCIGSVAMKAEVKGAPFLMQSGLALGRLNIFMATLPASLEACAGSSLVNAGVKTARALMDIGSCSTNSVMSNFGGSFASAINPSSAANTASASASSAADSISAAISNAGSAGSAISSAASSAINKIPSFP